MKLKKVFKWYFLVPSVIILIIILAFLIWFIKPAKTLDIAILDKTTPATSADGESYLGDVENNYRKHLGSNWIADYLKIKNPETDELYDYTTDYYGNKFDDEGKIIKTDKLTSMKKAPDLLYLADSYGIEGNKDKGITAEEMNMISYCNSLGSTIIGEQDILTTGTDSKISSQLQSLFGISSTSWVGRYIYDLADLSDVPYWAPDMYLEKYGVEWRCSGSGILLVSGSGDIIVLEESTDFKSKNLLKIAIADDYKSEFGSKNLNYYNWFELINVEKGTEALAEYTFNLNSTGMENFKPVSSSPTFTAVTRKTTKYGGVNYYFAGDFNDFVTETKPYCFLGADLLYRLISFDKEGDITNFYWNFYEPMMKKIMKDCLDKSSEESKNKNEVNSVPPRIKDNTFEVNVDGKWQNLNLKGFNINGEAPGDKRYSYSNDASFFQTLIKKAEKIGANAIRAYDLYSPEFYRALFEHNSDKDNKKIYLIQSVTTPTNVDKSNIYASINELKNNAKIIVDALHGAGTKVDSVGERKGGVYSFDVSPYILGYVIDTDLTKQQFNNLQSNSLPAFSGEYFSSNGSSSAESLIAELCDYTMSYSVKNYKQMNIVFAKGFTDLISNSLWIENNDSGFNVGNIEIKDSKAINYFGVCYSAFKYDNAVVNYSKKLQKGRADAFDGYLSKIISSTDKPVLIDAFGASTASNTYDKYSDVYGLSELQQSDAIITMHKQIVQNGFLGGLIKDLNDSWVKLSDESAMYTVPEQDSALWHDVTDLEQTTGVLAVESKEPGDVGLDFSTTSERMQNLRLYINPTYLYYTITLDKEVNFDKEELIVGIDTYQRNDGEYYYDKGYFANSLSGMEFVVKFDSKRSAAVYAVPSYSRNGKKVTSTERYKGKYNFVAQLNYGGFSSANTHFFTAGSTISLRIPWAMLNITDPSQRIVIDDKQGSFLHTNRYKTTITSGLIASVLIGEKGTKDTAYIFPESKKSAGYKTYKWLKWETVDYEIKEKESFTRIKTYFEGY